MLIWLTFAGSHPAMAGVSSHPAGAELVQLQVLVVNDPAFAPLTLDAATTILDEARRTVVDKLRFSGLTFRIIGSVGTAEFLRHDAAADDSCWRRLVPHRVRWSPQPAAGVEPADVTGFLRRWPLRALQQFFPLPQRTQLKSYEALASSLLDEFTRKVGLIAGLSLPHGEMLLAPQHREARSFVHWLCTMRRQPAADIVLTNAFILYDLATEPYPHAIFQKCSVGGASFPSAVRAAMRGRAILASTFAMDTQLPFFRDPEAAALTPNAKLKVIGSYILAHELGHALLKIPDFYDHPFPCLMTTQHAAGYVAGYSALKRSLGPCPRCARYLAAHRHIVAADQLRHTGRWGGAIAALKQAVATTPKHVDGSYNEYIARLAVEIAQLFALEGHFQPAERWLATALSLVPEESQGRGFIQATAQFQTATTAKLDSLGIQP